MASINDLASLSAPASGDQLAIYDASATADRKIDAGLVPWTNTPSVFTESVTMPATRSSGSNTINDDAAISLTPDKVSPTALAAGTYAGMLLIWGRFGNPSNLNCVIGWRAGTNNYCVAVAQPAAVVNATTGALTGTTGTDGKLNVSTHTDGKIYIENRTGAQINIGYAILG